MYKLAHFSCIIEWVGVEKTSGWYALKFTWHLPHPNKFETYKSEILTITLKKNHNQWVLGTIHFCSQVPTREECPAQHVSHSNFVYHTFVTLRAYNPNRTLLVWSQSIIHRVYPPAAFDMPITAFATATPLGVSGNGTPPWKWANASSVWNELQPEECDQW